LCRGSQSQIRNNEMSARAHEGSRVRPGSILFQRLPCFFFQFFPQGANGAIGDLIAKPSPL
jgi:hypothetical protein